MYEANLFLGKKFLDFMSKIKLYAPSKELIPDKIESLFSYDFCCQK